MQQQVHLGQQEWQWLRFTTEDAIFQQNAPMLDGLRLLAEMIKRLDQESASAACRIEHRLAKPWIRHFHHEPNQRSWRVELAGITSGVTHLLQHRLVEMTEGVNFFRGTEVYTVDFVHDLPKQEATVHPVN